MEQMEQMHFNGFLLHYPTSLNVYSNDTIKKVVFTSKNDDEIHGVLELDERNKIKIHPRWNVYFMIEDKTITINVNHESE